MMRRHRGRSSQVVHRVKVVRNGIGVDVALVLSHIRILRTDPLLSAGSWVRRSIPYYSIQLAGRNCFDVAFGFQVVAVSSVSR